MPVEPSLAEVHQWVDQLNWRVASQVHGCLSRSSSPLFPPVGFQKLFVLL